MIVPNSKPWLSQKTKCLVNEKKVAFQSGDRTMRHEVQAKLRKGLRQEKREYRDKLERQFTSGNMKEVWDGLKTLTGEGGSKTDRSFLSAEEKVEFSDKLNGFYCRFEREDVGEEMDRIVSQLRDMAKDEMDDFVIDRKSVESLFLKLKVKKASGPDGICGRLLKECAVQLSGVFSFIFNMSVTECAVPSIWKKSLISPVPKKKTPSCLNDYRPVALTPIVMKCFERLVLKRLLTFTSQHLDPFQFAYKPNRGTDDALLTLLHNAFMHVNNTGSFIRILFVDFSSAFNTIQPHLLALKLLDLSVSPNLILWLVNFLVNRTQSVCFQSALSAPRTTSTGSPQGTVLSPALFTLYTNDCQGTPDTPVIKYSDDTAIQDLSNSDDTYFREVQRFNSWCSDNFLCLNVSKTKELVVDFRSSGQPIPELVIDGESVERVNEFKYLGVIVDERLDFKRNTDFIHRKCQPRIFCLQKLRNFGISHEILAIY